MAYKTQLRLLLLTVWCISFSLNINTNKNLCPPFEVTDPCGCVGVETTVRLECIRTKNLSDIRRAILSLVTYSSKATEFVIDLIMLKFERIPSNLFFGVPVNIISFTNCQLEEIGDSGQPAFLGLEHSLKELSVSFSVVEGKGQKFLNLSNLQSLEHLEIEGNNIDSLPDIWFSSGPKTLQNVIFMTNDIQKLGPNIFASLFNTKNLWLTGNELIDGLSRSMLPMPALHLTSLDLTNNKITDLSEDIFSNMPSLKEVILDENKIQTLLESTWSSVWSQLSRLYLIDNPLDCDNNIKWLMNIRRPFVIKGICATPPNKKGQELKQLIDNNENINNY